MEFVEVHISRENDVKLPETETEIRRRFPLSAGNTASRRGEQENKLTEHSSNATQLLPGFIHPPAKRRKKKVKGHKK